MTTKMYSLITVLLFIFIARGEGTFSAGCNRQEDHLDIAAGATCTISGTGNVVRTISMGASSVLQFNDAAQFRIDGDVVIPTDAELHLQRNSRVTVNGYLTLVGSMDLHPGSILTVQDTLTLERDSFSTFNGYVEVSAQDFVMEDGSMMSGDGRGGLTTNALGFPSSPHKGGSHTSGSTVGGPHGDAYFVSSGGPAPHGSIRQPSYPGSPGRNGSNGLGGQGGAAIYINAHHTMIIDGLISSNGVGSGTSGAGAGGSIRLETKMLKHSSGVVTANGGASSTADPEAGGGGGRIAVSCLYAEFVNIESEDRRLLGFSVSADGNGQGPGTIWYDCGTLRSTLMLGTDNKADPEFIPVYVNVEDFEGVIVREMDIGRFPVVFTTHENRQNAEHNLYYGYFSPHNAAVYFQFTGTISPRSQPNPNIEECFDYRIVDGYCDVTQAAYAKIHEEMLFRKGATVLLPHGTTINSRLIPSANAVLVLDGKHLTVTSDIKADSVHVDVLNLTPTSELELTILDVSDLLFVEGYLLLRTSAPVADITVKDLVVTPTGTIRAISWPKRYPVAVAGSSYAGCAVSSDCLGNADTKPYGLFYDVKEGGSMAVISGTLVPSNALFTITVTGKISMGGHILAQRPDSTYNSGGSIRMQLNEVVSMRGKIDVAGHGSGIAGSSGGRAMITCNSDPYSSLFHTQFLAEGGCAGGVCAATGTVYLNCGYFQNYLKVVQPVARTQLPKATHILVDKNFVLDTVEVVGKGHLYFASVNNNSYQFEVKRIISSPDTPPKIEKASKIRLKLGQSAPPTLPSANAINAATSGFQTTAPQKQTQLNNVRHDIDVQYTRQTKLRWDVHVESTSYIYCNYALDMCLADECSGESTRFTRTGRERVGIRMAVDSFNNPLDVQTARDTLRDTLSNFYDVPQSDVIVSEPVASGTRVLNVTVDVDTTVTGLKRRVLLEKSSRIDDSPIESCFKRVSI